jgi:chromosome segregation ATPase
MSLTSNTPGETQATDALTLPRWVTVMFVVAFALVGYLLYATYADRQTLHRSQEEADKKTQALATELDRTNGRVADLKGQLQVTSQKLMLSEDELARARSLSQTARKEQQDSDSQLRQQIGAVQADTTTKFGQMTTQLTGTQNDLNTTKADLESVKGKMQSAIGDLNVQSGLIARNHDEVEELKRLGDRDIYEFALKKSAKAPERLGPIQAQLRKVDAKKFKFTMNVVADDKIIEKKDKTVGEPVQFYVRGARAPYEIVVFDLTKDQAKGYLSTPKSAGAAPAPGTPPGN